MIEGFIKLKIRAAIRQNKQAGTLLLNLLLLLMVLSYGWGLAKLLSLSYIEGAAELSSLQLIQAVSGMIFILGMLRMIFPGYQALQSIFPKYYPVSSILQYIISILSDFLKPYFFFLSIFLLTTSVFSNHFSFQFLFSGIILMLLAQFSRRIIQYMIDFRLQGKAYFIAGTSILLLIVAVFFLIRKPEYLAILSIATLMLAITLGYYLEKSIIRSIHRQRAVKRMDGWIFIKLLVFHPYARLPLLIAFVLKIAFLIADILVFRSEGEHLLGDTLVLWAIGSPMILFSYIFNNSWGYWKNLWLNLEIRSGGFKTLVLYQFRLMSLPLLIDLIITLPVLLSYWGDTQLVLLYYSSASILLIGFSILWSVYTPIRIRQSFQRKATSQLGTMVSIFCLMGLTLIGLNDWFYILVPVFLIAAITAVAVAKSFYPDLKYALLEKLRKR